MYISQQIAAKAVHQVLSGQNLTSALPYALTEFSDATSQQRGAAKDLSYGTLRFYGEISAYLEQLLEKPLSDGRVRALLLVAIYQLLHDKADAFTVVNQAVQATRSLKRPTLGPWAKGLVNAILRNFLRQKETLAQKINSNVAAQYSYQKWWINKLKIQYSQHWQAILEAGNQHPPLTLRINTQKVHVADYLQQLSEQTIEATQLGVQAVMLRQPMMVEKIPGFTEGLVSVQDYGAQLAAPLLDVQNGMRVLDACCAPGGKTGHILETANVALTALDTDTNRLKRVQENLHRLNLSAQLLTGDASSSAWWDGKQFDRILADVPCSASGIVRRHVDIKWLRRESDIASFATQQSKILLSLWQMLAKGGKLLYVTCSIFNEENQAQIDQFLQNNANATQLPFNLFESHTANLSHIDGQLMPCAAHDGFFYALLQKN